MKSRFFFDFLTFSRFFEIIDFSLKSRDYFDLHIIKYEAEAKVKLFNASKLKTIFIIYKLNKKM